MTLLAEAIELGDMELIEALLRDGEDVNELLPEGGSCLGLAMDADNETLMDLLVRYGADPNLCEPEEGTPLIYWAVWSDDWPMIERLRRYGARLDFIPHDGHAVLHVAAERNKPDLLARLLETEAVATMEAFDYVGRTALACAVWTDAFECARLLIRAGANVNVTDNESHCTCLTPLQRAADDGKLDLVRLLLESGADPRLTVCGMVGPPLELAKRHKRMPELAELIENALRGTQVGPPRSAARRRKGR
jgi:ankyrin repeat protein